MRHDPIEIPMLDTQRSVRPARRRPMSASAPSRRTSEPALRPDVVDEAFAFLPPDDHCARRVDSARPTSHSGVAGSPPAGPSGRDAALLGALASQVAALDRKCEVLTSLLQTLEATSIDK